MERGTKATAFYIKHRIKLFIFTAGVLVYILLCELLLPRPLFEQPLCLVMEDQNGQLLGASIAADGQWRFPPGDSIPVKYTQALLHFEDKRFAYHPGIDPLALARALMQNLKSGRVVSGGSTLTMQVVRLARQKNRTLLQKSIEMMLAVYLEMKYSKEEILRIYASHAPFGGNVVGLEAASWRYFGTQPRQLTWGESALLAVLPNNPSMVHPGRNREHLVIKRNHLLQRLCSAGIIDSLTCGISQAEPLPDRPYPIPRKAPQLLTRILNETKNGGRYKTTLSGSLQESINSLMIKHSAAWNANSIHNAAVLVIEVESGKTLAYVGNLPGETATVPHGDVDIIMAPRSPGSTLKPILYAAMLSDGLILPTTLVADIPARISGFAPKNFDLSHCGAIPARQALARSLNVPAVFMLRQYGVERFHHLMKNLGFTTLTQPPGHYGLSLILGGCEVTLWELCGVYSSMARMLNHYPLLNGGYHSSDLHMPYFLNQQGKLKNNEGDPVSFFTPGASAIYCMWDAMEEVMRPGEEALWKNLGVFQKIAWKTGTSYGFRDAWAIGCTPRYVVGVWAGNADGEGRPGLTGLSAAAPLLFDIFALLPSSPWFPIPYDDMIKTAVCRESGYRPSVICEHLDTVWIPRQGLRTFPCPYHKWIHLDETGRWRVSSDCEAPSKMQRKSWFVLPPVMESFFRTAHAEYTPLPPWKPGCQESQSEKNMEIIYPLPGTRIFVPLEIDGTPGKAIFEAAHRNPSFTLYWYLDQTYLGETRETHQMAVNPDPGKHVLILTDEHGERLEIQFEVTGENTEKERARLPGP